jgi:dipeptidyl aminopeptidase/acylaminoacyl peptidase
VDRGTGAAFALRSTPLEPPRPVRIDPDGTVTPLATPAPPPSGPARVEEVKTVTEEGVEVRGWLVLPETASVESPAPLLLFIHGGPLSSWSAWSWRWNPSLAAARGYAVLLPDPALSTGYGLDFIARGWNAWGGAPFRDLMAITDATEARDDIDDTRTAALGGSFGGYMANWVAGHTDRFRAIVSHASLWAINSFRGATDRSDFWDQELTPEGALANSPHRFVGEIRTPMLLIHGDRDYRVPVGESIRLWSDLAAHHAREDGTTDHRYLYFPDENHWILRPQHTIIWYETVFAFLAEHVLGEDWKRPAHLG